VIGAVGQADAARLMECLGGGGVAVFPTDTVYGVGCDPDDEQAVRRLYELKGRPADRPAAVMFFDRELALSVLEDLRTAERAAVSALLPGPVTLLLPNRSRRFPLACGPTPREGGALGLRVPLLREPLAALQDVSRPIMQSSANLSGGPDARRLSDVPRELLLGADLALDGGDLSGVASTVVDLREYERTGAWAVVREGALELDAVERALA
jgi:L-threonylcarbamoyladenylate synthase